MDIFSQRKILVTAIVVLVLLNLSLVGIVGFGLFSPKQKLQPKPADEMELASILKQELDLSPQQAEELKNIRTEFFQREQIITRSIRSKRDSMNLLMFGNNSNDTLLKRLAVDVSQGEYNMELLRIEQAAKLRTICDAGQLSRLQKLVKEIRDYLRPDSERK